MEFEKYKKLVTKYYQIDCREVNFQNRVIIPFLESFLPEGYDVVDSSTIYRNWKDRKDQFGNGVCRKSFANNYTPDLLITKNWKLFDNEKPAPSIIIEVKCPTARDRKHSVDEITEYLEKTEHVILTDGITWEFHDKQENDKSHPLVICLDKTKSPVCKRDITGRNVTWENEDSWQKLKDTIKKLIK